jgi:hypothetical protein
MPIVRTILSDGNKQPVIQYILDRKKERKFTVIDVGGSDASWSTPYIDALVDINPVENSKLQCFYGDINEDDVWQKVREWVSKNGKFDFCICTHTLEDIRNPLFVTKQISLIAKEGYVSFPSKHKELSRFEYGPHAYRGYIHHRWIFTIKNNILKGYPKLNLIEFLPELDRIADLNKDKSDQSFYWKDNIELFLVNSDYLGPSPRDVIKYYLCLLDE